jgi:acyl carrier protein
MADIRNEVIKIIQKVCDTLRLEPGDFSKPLSDVGIDSLDLTSILLQLEERLGIGIPDDDVAKIETIDKIIEYVTARKAQG